MRTSGSDLRARAPSGLSDTAELLRQCRTHWARVKAKNPSLALVLILLTVLAVDGGEPREPWPPFLGPRETYPVEVVAAVDRLWKDTTLHRIVRGRPAPVPPAVWMIFADTPELTADAARHLRLARYEVEPLDMDTYRATDNEGARGLYRVLARLPGRRVILSWGTHRSWLLGTVSGSALSVLDFHAGPDGIEPTLAAYVKIDNAVLAHLARVLITLFGALADRKLAEGFTVTRGVAEWAVAQRHEFCEWLGQEPLPADRRERVLAVFPECA